MVKFKATVRKFGNSHVITIPSDFVQNGYITEGIEYIWENIEKTGESNGTPQTPNCQ